MHANYLNDRSARINITPPIYTPSAQPTILQTDEELEDLLEALRFEAYEQEGAKP
jgi:hypothetical protein